MDIYRYFEVNASIHSYTNAYLLALASFYIYPSELPGVDGFEAKLRKHFEGYSDTDPFQCKLITKTGSEAAILSNSRLIIVAFRGTEKSLDLEWVGRAGNTNFGFHLPYPSDVVQVHKGMYNGLEAIATDVYTELNTLKNQNDRPVFLTGHSRGGAFALLFTYELKSIYSFEVDGVYVFGCPRVGDIQFRDSYNRRFLDEKTFRWVNYADPGNRFPDYASLINKSDSNRYYHVGQLNYINGRGGITLGHSNPDFEPNKGLNPLIDGKYHDMDRYIRIMYTQLSSMNRDSATNPDFLTQGDPVIPLPNSFNSSTQILAAGEYTIRQKSTGRYLDAHENSKNNYFMVTRPAQNNDTQRWVLLPIGNGRYTAQQKSSGRYMMAYHDHHNRAFVTRPANNKNSQRWDLIPEGSSNFRIKQVSTGRYMDASLSSSNGYRALARGFKGDLNQLWEIKKVGN